MWLKCFIGDDFKNIRRYKEFEVSPQGEWVDLDVNLDNPPHEVRMGLAIRLRGRRQNRCRTESLVRLHAHSLAVNRSPLARNWQRVTHQLLSLPRRWTGPQVHHLATSQL
jgi:hypothetical protein